MNIFRALVVCFLISLSLGAMKRSRQDFSPGYAYAYSPEIMTNVQDLIEKSTQLSYEMVYQKLSEFENQLGEYFNHKLGLRNLILPNRYTPLNFAIAKNNLKVVDALLNLGVPPVSFGMPPANFGPRWVRRSDPLCASIIFNHIEIARLLISKMDLQTLYNSIGIEALHTVVKVNGSIDIANLLLENGVLIDATREVSPDITPLHSAVNKGFGKMVRWLLKKGANKEARTSRGYTPLHLAIENGNSDLASLLLVEGASREAETSNGFSPLHLAANKGKIDLVRKLLEKGANVEACDRYGKTPLYLAVKNRQAEVVIELLQAKANIENAMSRGATSYVALLDLLKVAVQNNSNVILKLLLEHSPAISGDDLFDLFSLAVKCSSLEVIQVLLEEDGGHLVARSKEDLLSEIFPSRSQDILELLVDFGFPLDLNFSDTNKNTPLHWAAIRSHVSLMNKILNLAPQGQQKHLLNKFNSFKMTPLMLLISNMDRSKFSKERVGIESLMGYGANPLKTNEKGFSVFDIARKNGLLEFADRYEGLEFNEHSDEQVSATEQNDFVTIEPFGPLITEDNRHPSSWNANNLFDGVVRGIDDPYLPYRISRRYFPYEEERHLEFPRQSSPNKRVRTTVTPDFLSNPDIQFISIPPSTLGEEPQAPVLDEDQLLIFERSNAWYLTLEDETMRYGDSSCLTGKRVSFIMAGRANPTFPEENEGGRVILVITKDELDKKQRLLGERRDLLVIKDVLPHPLHPEYHKYPQYDFQDPSLVTNRRIAALDFADKAELDDFIMIDDNIDGIFISHYLAFFQSNGDNFDWSSVYELMKVASQQQKSALVALRQYRHNDYRPPMDRQIYFSNKVGSKILFLDLAKIRDAYQQTVEARYIDPVYLFPAHADTWGEDLYLNFLLRGLKTGEEGTNLKSGTIGRLTALFTTSSSEINACQKSLKSNAGYWLNPPVNLEQSFPSDLPGLFQPVNDAHDAMKQVVKDNLEYRGERRDQIRQNYLDSLAEPLSNNLERTDFLKNTFYRELKSEIENLVESNSYLTGPANEDAEQNLSFLFKHQAEALQALIHKLQDGNLGGYFNLATGTGKTRIFLTIIALALKVSSENGYVPNIALVLPTIDLVEQTFRRLQKFNDHAPEGLQTDAARFVRVSSNHDHLNLATAYHEEVYRDIEARAPVKLFCLRSFQNLVEARPDEDFDLVIVDECHYHIGQNIGEWLGHQQGVAGNLVLGFSATPKANTTLFGDEIYSFSTQDGIEAEILSPFVEKEIDIDINDDGLELLAAKLNSIRGKFAIDYDYYPRKGMVFLTNGGSDHNRLKKLTSLLNEIDTIGFKAGYILSTIPQAQIQDVLQKFENNEIKILIVDRMLEVGFDDPSVDFVIDLKKNKRESHRSIQRRGRALRNGPIFTRQEGKPTKMALYVHLPYLGE